MGMSEAETKRKFDAIVEFADIGKFMDTPVSHYSSGMYARLGFSIAIHVDADIFLADEVLAVGDRPFKKKCMAKMQEIRQQGTTIFYVSHATASVRAMCDRVLVLDCGLAPVTGQVDACAAMSPVLAGRACGLPVQVVGWCLGGIMALLSVAYDPELPVNSAALVASPFDSRQVRAMLSTRRSPLGPPRSPEPPLPLSRIR